LSCGATVGDVLLLQMALVGFVPGALHWGE